MLGHEERPGVGAGVGDHDRHQGGRGGGLETVSGSREIEKTMLLLSSSIPLLSPIFRQFNLQWKCFPMSQQRPKLPAVGAPTCPRALVFLIAVNPSVSYRATLRSPVEAFFTSWVQDTWWWGMVTVTITGGDDGHRGGDGDQRWWW